MKLLSRATVTIYTRNGEHICAINKIVFSILPTIVFFLCFFLILLLCLIGEYKLRE